MYYWTVQKFICVGRRLRRRRWPKVIFGFILFTICLFLGRKVESDSGWSFWINGPRSGLIITSAIITFIYQAFGSLGPPRGACRSQGMSTNKRPPGVCSRFPGEAEAAKKSLGEVNWPRALKTMRQALFECDDISTRATFFLTGASPLLLNTKTFRIYCHQPLGEPEGRKIREKGW